MDQKEIAKLVSGNLKTLYAFSLSKLYDKSEADDLTAEIVSDCKLQANFPVFTEEVLNRIREILKPLSEDVFECMSEICEIGAKTLISFSPKVLADKCEQLSYIHHQMDVMALIIEEMVNDGSLVITNDSEKLCVFGVKK